MSSSQQRRLATYEAADQECARIVLADVAKYGGDEALLVQWAHSVVASGARAEANPVTSTGMERSQK